jgi:hypothetical protein
MSCWLEARDGSGHAQRFTIEWRDTGETKVRIEGPEVTQTRTLHLPREAASLLALTRTGPSPERPQIGNPVLLPAEAHLSPERLGSLLAGRWTLLPGSTDARPGEERFRVSLPGRPDAVRVTVDRETGLPVSVEQYPLVSDSPPWTRARFVWNLGPSSPRLLNGRDRPAPGSESLDRS